MRGIPVDFSPKAINSHLLIPEVEECEFSRLLQTPGRIDYDLYKEKLTIRNTQWISVSRRSESQTYFPENTLNRVAKTWHKFICHNLLPTSHDNNVTHNRCVHLYGICVGWPLNVGLIIWETMKSVAKSPKTRRVSFGSLIHDMYRNIGVVINTS